jgi:hypothetical protein
MGVFQIGRDPRRSAQQHLDLSESNAVPSAVRAVAAVPIEYR